MTNLHNHQDYAARENVFVVIVGVLTAFDATSRAKPYFNVMDIHATELDHRGVLHISR